MCIRDSNENDFDQADVASVAQLGLGSSMVFDSRPASGWRICRTSFDGCKQACAALDGCAEISMAPNGCCFVAKSTCSGSQRTGDTKYVAQTADC